MQRSRRTEGLARKRIVGRFRLLLLLLVALSVIAPASPLLSQQDAPTLPKPSAVLSVAQRVNDYWVANRTGAEDNAWSRAVYFTGNMAHYQMTGASRYADYAWNWAESGFDWQLHHGCSTVFADDQAAAQTYLALLDLDPERADISCVLNSIEQSMAWGWLEVDLGTVTDINRFLLHSFEDRAYKYLIDVKSNPSDPYVMVVDHSDASMGESTITSTPARYVRLRVIGAEGYSGEWVSLSELQIFGESDPTTNVALNRPVLCSSEPQAENSCTQLVDGNLATRWSASFHDNFSESSPNWWWIDALYMAAPIYAELSNLEAQGKIAGTSGYSTVLYAKYNETKDQRALFDATHALWYRDTRFLGMRTPADKPIFWSRGNGWVFAAHARLLNILPATDPHYQEYLTTFQAMANALLDTQDQAGYWNMNLVDPTHCGGPESSGTAFFTFGLAWGIKNGSLDRATYLPTLLKGWEWLAQRAVQNNPDGFVGYVQNVGDRPTCGENNPLPGPTDTADFGVGAFLLAASEVYELTREDAPALHLPLISK